MARQLATALAKVSRLAVFSRPPAHLGELGCVEMERGQGRETQEVQVY